MPRDPTIERFRAIVGHDHVLVDDDVRAGYETDWTGRYGGSCSAVVRPADTTQVAAVVATCNELGVDVIPQAGNTGLVGGGVPRRAVRRSRPVIVLSMRRLASISDIDTASMQLTAGAGATIAEWRAAARSVGLDTPVDFAARDTATVGGAIATNAGGSRVVRFSTMRHQVVGIEAVLADGRLVGSLAGLPKETVGLHWPSLLSGSEGTLAVVTAARLRLTPLFEHITTVLVSLDGLASALQLLGSLRTHLPSLDSVEAILPEAMELVAQHRSADAPLAVRNDGIALLVECADHTDPSEAVLRVLASAEGVVDSAVATDGPARERLVAFRDRITESIAAEASRIGRSVFKLDVAVPLAALDEVLVSARSVADRQRARLIPFGHLAEGNLHLNFLAASDTDAIADEVLAAVARLGGTISAEHGVGIAKTRWLHLVRRAGDLDAQSAIRHALDPNGILNPGVLARLDVPGDQVP